MAASDYIRRWLLPDGTPIRCASDLHAPDGARIQLYKNWLEFTPRTGQPFRIYAGQFQWAGGSLWARRGPHNGIYFVLRFAREDPCLGIIGIGAELCRDRKLQAEPDSNLTSKIIAWFYSQYCADVCNEQTHMDLDFSELIPARAFYRLQLRDGEEHDTW